MKKLLGTVVVVAAALTAVIGYRALASGEPARERRTSAQRAQPRRDATDSAHAEHEDRDLLARRRPPPLVEHATSKAPEATQGSVIEQASKRKIAPALSDQDRIHKFQTRFEMDTLDPSWSRGAEQRVVSNLTEKLPTDQRLLNVACRSRFCRIEIQVDKSSTEPDPSGALAGKMLFWDGPGEILPLTGEGGALRLVMFLGRDPRVMDL